MSEKMAFAYSHGGPVFNPSSRDSFNDRGRNIVRSMHSAASSGCDKIFVSEAVSPGGQSQMKILMAHGHFKGIEHLLDIQEYSISQNVKFPKNYLMNRCAQRAHGFFGLIFTDSDVLFDPGFPKRAADDLKKSDFIQPEYIFYLNASGSGDGYLETTMKRASIEFENYKNNLSYISGMPGMVNIAQRNAFLEIGGFSQAISGVNFEDIEYQIRLKILNRKTSFMHDEWCKHLFHSRSAISRQTENLPGMFFDNGNFLNWWVDHFLQIKGIEYDKKHFETYMEIIRQSLLANESTGTYINETGSITSRLGFNPIERYRGFCFGAAEPYVEYGTKEEKIAAVMNASQFWKIPYEWVIRVNPGKFHDITVKDVENAERERNILIKIGEKGKQDRLIQIDDQRKRSEILKERLKQAIGKSTEKEKRESKELSDRMKKLLKARLRP